MKSIRNNIFSLAVLILLVHTCAKDSDENLDEDESYVESMYGEKKEVVQADWKKFMLEANKMISISENNLKSLRLKIDHTENGVKKNNWNVDYGLSRYQLEKLKEKLERRDIQFTDEMKDYDGSSGKINADFKTSFLQEIVELNNTLEDIIDE